MKYKMSELKKTILAALLLALFIVLDRFISINTHFLKVNISLIPIMIAGMTLGWKYSMLIGIMGDLIGSIYWPFGPYYAGFTFSAGLTGIIFGLFLYETPNKEQKLFILKAIVSTAIVLTLIKVCLDSLWLHRLYKEAYRVYITARIVTQTVMFPIYVTSIVVLEKVLKDPIKRYLYREESEE